MKILVCDDSIVIRQLIGTYLEKMGHKPIYAENGKEAVMLFNKESPDLVIIDVDMPGMNGYEATKAIRQKWTHFSEWTPIIFLSSNIDDDSIVNGIEAGGDDYLTKPVSNSILRAKIHAMGRLALMRDKLIDFSRQLREANEKLHISNQALSELSLKDPLTQLGNRRAFEDNLSKACKGAAREGSSLCLLMVDVDNFKHFNDTYGHQSGDNCLKRVAEQLKQGVHRPADFVSRFGGEEFAIILPQTSLSAGVHVAERLRFAVQSMQMQNENAPQKIVTISIGVACMKVNKAFEANSLISASDEALYEAKGQGRNRVIASKQFTEERMPELKPDIKRQRRFPSSDSSATH